MNKILSIPYYFFSDIKLTHSVFALPFAASAILFCQDSVQLNVTNALFLLVCMVSARSFAMGMNRFLDHKIDAQNKRTQNRLIPLGKLTARQSLVMSLMMSAVFIFAAFQLSKLAGLLSIPLLAFLGFYSKMKTVSFMTHFYLGLCLGFSPIAVNIALTGSVSWPVLLLGLAITLWTAGFDIIYSTQDCSFDHKHNLKSIPQHFGIRNAVYISRGCFAGMVFLLYFLGVTQGMGFVYMLGTGLIAVILGYEQWLIRDLVTSGESKYIDIAFFTVNGWVGVFFFVFTLIDVLLYG